MTPWPRCGWRPAPSSSWPLSDRGAHGFATIPLGKAENSDYVHMGWILPHGSPRNLVVPCCSSLELPDFDGVDVSYVSKYIYIYIHKY